MDDRSIYANSLKKYRMIPKIILFSFIIIMVIGFGFAGWYIIPISGIISFVLSRLYAKLFYSNLERLTGKSNERCLAEMMAYDNEMRASGL